MTSSKAAHCTVTSKATRTQRTDSKGRRFTNYVVYQDPVTFHSRVGHYDIRDQLIQPLSFSSGYLIHNLNQVIEAHGNPDFTAGSHVIPSGSPLAASSIKILPPFTGRDVLCVGKNYAEHAKEFNSSGFDSSDKVDQPSHPVIFTKRYTSIIAHGEEILPHDKFTQTLDYEGEIGVIVGKAGYRISEKDAMNHVWGYTIINDMTARERQRDHKQFYIGKSPDTFCPMGPLAVPVSELDTVLRIETRVNGELRQKATTDDLIFSIPCLVKTMSEGQTLMPGDVLATGTPAGVGFGQHPPAYLRPGDEVEINVTGLGTLKNRIAMPGTCNRTLNRYQSAISAFQYVNSTKLLESKASITINNKPLYHKSFGKSDGPTIVFVHGLGATTEYFSPLISHLKLDEEHNLHLYDFEGHGLSPTHPLSRLSIATLATDLNGIFEHAGISSKATLIADGLGCLIALQFVKSHPEKVSKSILLSPPPSPVPDDLSVGLLKRAAIARKQGMTAVVDPVANNTIEFTLTRLGPLARAAQRMSLLGQDPEGYAKACTAFSEVTETQGTVGSANVHVFSTRERTTEALVSDDWSIFQNLDEVANFVRKIL